MGDSSRIDAFTDAAFAFVVSFTRCAVWAAMVHATLPISIGLSARGHDWIARATNAGNPA